MRKIIAIALILVVYNVTVFARPIIRIKFPKGATKVTVSGKLNGYKDSQTFVIKLKKGQTLKVDADKPVSLYISDPNGNDASDMDASCHSHQIVENTKAGDYKIKAVECMKADAWKGKFNLTVRAK
jgi:hypothetical protein